ncbi:MAG: polysaccharide deacetylase family protein [Robiginitomaculum sp.]
MTYQPKNSVFKKLERRLRIYKNTRNLDFSLERPIVSITFDDFPKTAMTIGARKMEVLGWAATFYTAAGLADSVNHHGPQFSPGDLLELEARGHEIGGHTYSHADCAALSEPAVLAEIDKNIAALKAMGVAGNIESFAYPFGAATGALKGALEPRFKSLRGISGGVHTGRADRNELKSYGFYSSTADAVIAQIEALAARPAWLTLFTHDIQERPTQWGCTQGEFDRLLTAIQKSGAQVLPITQAIKQLESRHAQ